MKDYRIVKDLNGVEVTANDIERDRMIFADFKKGMFGTLWNKERTFWADVECVSKRGNKYTFVSTTYGHKFVVNFDDNTVMYNA